MFIALRTSLLLSQGIVSIWSSPEDFHLHSRARPDGHQFCQNLTDDLAFVGKVRI